MIQTDSVYTAENKECVFVKHYAPIHMLVPTNAKVEKEHTSHKINPFFYSKVNQVRLAPPQPQ